MVVKVGWRQTGFDFSGMVTGWARPGQARPEWKWAGLGTCRSFYCISHLHRVTHTHNHILANQPFTLCLHSLLHLPTSNFSETFLPCCRQPADTIIEANCTDVHLNWHSCVPRRRNQLWKFSSQSVKGFRFWRGPKFAISHWLSRLPLTQCCRCCAARDRN